MTVRYARRYLLVTPPGWYRVRLDDRALPSFDRIVRLRTGGALERQAVVLRERARRSLVPVIENLRAAQVRDLYLPTRPIEGVAVPAMVTVTPAWSERVVADKEDLLLALAAADPTARAVDVAESVAVRTTESAPASGAAGVDVRSVIAAVTDARAAAAAVPDEANLTSRRVAYVIGVPGDDGAWLSVAFSTIQSQHEGSIAIADALVDLFDAMMTTFAWLAPEEQS